jgi:DNA polymerase III epsilon subunit-like protein
MDLHFAPFFPIDNPPSTYNISPNMSSPDHPPPPVDPPRACSGIGHDRRNCPVFPRATAASGAVNPTGNPNRVVRAPPPAPFAITTVQDPSTIDWEKVVYVVFDLETTGGNRRKNEIIELAAVILDKNGIPIEDATFISFIRPKDPIPPFITMLTSITNNDVCDAESFSEVTRSFIGFMQQHADELNVDNILLVGHNGRVFDIPFFLHQVFSHNMHEQLFGDSRFRFGLDTMRITKKAVSKSGSSIGVPTAYNLKSLFQFVTGSVLDNAHRALDDVKATMTLLRYEAFWDNRKEDLFQFVLVAGGTVLDDPAQDDEAGGGDNDSIVEEDDDVSSSSSSSSEEDDELSLLGNRWEEGADFEPEAPTPMERFNELMTEAKGQTIQLVL